MDKDEELLSKITDGARQLVDEALRKQQTDKHPQLGIHHWLMALLERHGPMIDELVADIDRSELKSQLRAALQAGDTGATLEVPKVLEAASQRAQVRGQLRATERDLAAVVLKAAGYVLKDAGPGQSDSSRSDASSSTGVEAAITWAPRARRPTPTLEQFGRDLTREALEGRLTPLVGRDSELEVMIETLCRPTKRNPVLVGPAGVGKTAIVEGLAQRIVTGSVPAALKGMRILALQPSVVVAGASVVGELEKRIRAILAEASQDGIILFIDEVHSMVGAGGREGSGDVASLVKPALARGDLACIAATTDDEFRRYIEPDEALARRFQPIRVQELTEQQTLAVLKSIRDERARREKVLVPDEVLEWLVSFSKQFLRNRYFPDKAVDLLEQCIGYGRAHELTEVTKQHAEEVAQRMVGMPVSPEERLNTLRENILACKLMREPDISMLCDRLAVTLRGLDLRPSRPNAVVILAGKMAEKVEALARTIAEALFGAPERVVQIDFSRFQSHYDLSMLIGAAPGLVGYDAQLPIHRIANMPWCVLRCDNIDRCHPGVRTVFMQAIRDGHIADARSRRIYLSDTVILLTSRTLEPAVAKSIGFGGAHSSKQSQVDTRTVVEEAVGSEFAGLVDLVCIEPPNLEDMLSALEQLLNGVAERFRTQGVELCWDHSVVEWLQRRKAKAGGDCEQIVETQLLPKLVKLLSDSAQPAGARLMVRCHADELVVENY